MSTCKYSSVVFEIPMYGENQNLVVNLKIGQINNDTYATPAVSNKTNFHFSTMLQYSGLIYFKGGYVCILLGKTLPFLCWYVSHQTRKSKAISFIDA